MATAADAEIVMRLYVMNRRAFDAAHFPQAARSFCRFDGLEGGRPGGGTDPAARRTL